MSRPRRVQPYQRHTARQVRKNRPWEQTNRPSTIGPYSHTSTWEQGTSHMGACCIWEERRGEEREKELISMWVLPYGKEARTERGKYR